MEDDISKDCIRTFIDGEDDAETKRCKLGLLLKLYGREHPEVGYTQGTRINRHELYWSFTVVKWAE